MYFQLILMVQEQDRIRPPHTDKHLSRPWIIQWRSEESEEGSCTDDHNVL
jgi:hypothetical protein